MTSGKSFDGKDESQIDTLVRYILLNFLIFMGGSLLFIFGFMNLHGGETAKGIFDIGIGVMTIVGFIVLRTNAPFVISCFLCASSSTRRSACSSPGLRRSPIRGNARIASSACTFSFWRAHEYTKQTKDRRVARLTRALKPERDEIATMKDNLKVGLFLMDRDCAIQPQFSKALADILMEDDLGGRSFLDLLDSSVRQKKRETLADYFTMVFNRAYDAQMLEDINPLHEFT